MVTDLARAVGPALQPHCNDIVMALLTNLQNPATPRSVKPLVMSCLGDIAMALQGAYEPYLTFVAQMMGAAAQTVIANPSFEDVDFVNALRCGLLEGYSGIVIGLTDGQKGYMYARTPVLHIVVTSYHLLLVYLSLSLHPLLRFCWSFLYAMVPLLPYFHPLFLPCVVL